jgi:hypothetical protein
MRSNSNTGAIILIALGTYFLLSKHGWLPNLGSIISEWWPVILILLGLSMLFRRSSRD